MDVMLNVPHYRGYLKAMNLLYEGSKVASIVYKEQTKLSEYSHLLYCLASFFSIKTVPRILITTILTIII